LQPLLRKSERIDWGGAGVTLLSQCSLEEILFRWSFWMVEKSLSKLRPLIELIEEQLINKNVLAQGTKASYFLPSN